MISLCWREQSADATSIDGGCLGNVDPATLRPELRAALKLLKPGESPEPIQVPEGWAILKILPANEVAEMDEAEQQRQMALRAESALRYTPDVSGFIGAESVFFHAPQPAGWPKIFTLSVKPDRTRLTRQ